MTLSDWIVKTKPKAVAKALRVDPSAVCAWKTGKACPRPKHLVRIEALSGGEVKIEAVIKQFAKRRRRN